MFSPSKSASLSEPLTRAAAIRDVKAIGDFIRYRQSQLSGDVTDNYRQRVEASIKRWQGERDRLRQTWGL